MTMLDQKDYKRQKADGPRGAGYLKTLPLGTVSRHADPGVPIVYGTAMTCYRFDSDGDLLYINADIPLDYDNISTYSANDTLPSDQLVLRLLAVGYGVDTNTLAVVSVNRSRAGQTSDGTDVGGYAALTLTSAQTATQTVPSTAVGEYLFTLNGLLLRPGDAITIAIGCNVATGGATDGIQVFGVQAYYRTNEVPTNGLTDSDLY